MDACAHLNGSVGKSSPHWGIYTASFGVLLRLYSYLLSLATAWPGVAPPHYMYIASWYRCNFFHR